MLKKVGRPSPALMISLLALFVALGGTGYAAIIVTGKNVKNSSLTGKDVKNSSLTGKDVKNSSLTGSDVTESKLGKVPSATTADSATTAGSAGSADTVGGLTLRKVAFRVAGGTANTTIFSGAGLTITASCLANNVALNATTSVQDSSIYTNVVDTDADNVAAANDLESGTFDTGSLFNLLDTNDGNPGLITFNYEGADGRTVTGNLSADEGGSPQCHVVGTVIAG